MQIFLGLRFFLTNVVQKKQTPNCQNLNQIETSKHQERILFTQSEQKPKKTLGNIQNKNHCIFSFVK